MVAYEALPDAALVAGRIYTWICMFFQRALKWGDALRSVRPGLLRNPRGLGLTSAAVLAATWPMAVAALNHWARQIPSIVSSTLAGSAAIAIVPFQTLAGIDQVYWISAYAV